MYSKRRLKDVREMNLHKKLESDKAEQEYLDKRCEKCQPDAKSDAKPVKEPINGEKRGLKDTYGGA